jgi:hypothetical protein
MNRPSLHDIPPIHWLVVLGILPIAAAFELISVRAISENLTLNVRMLVRPVKAIKNWQGGV